MIPDKALAYYYCLAKKQLNEGRFKGLWRKKMFDFIKMMDNLQKDIEDKRVTNFEEVIENEYK